MLKFTLKKILGIIPTLLVIIFLCFFVMRMAPGSPFDSEKPIDPQVKARLMEKYHLDKPFYIQAFYYISNALKGDLGPSLKKKDLTVSQYIKLGFPKSLTLGVISLIISLSIGIPIGILAAIYKNTYVDYIITSIAILGISIPLFVIGPILQYFFAIKWGLLYTSGWITERGGFSNLILPIITLSMPNVAIFARIIRGSMLEIIQSDFIRTARAKGLSFKTIVIKHMLRGAMLPVVSYIGPAFAAIISGSVVIEKIFRIAGMGMFITESALNRDYPVLMGGLLVYSIILLISILISDIIYKMLDPRV
ncbi:ABC transporter permease [Borreliella burgdorferi]|uniref:ABC transporter, permease protein n=1 Tax=Borreliella burgdorferi 118a TaxID=476210 RepID=A0A7U8I5T6_BORBG|nr:ABC transporter permease [Borreliella burgdorferi]ATH09894.1 ABC transporter permease [Borreliella burgdorferi]EEE18682.1 ABC transporter, permease protein [Borreliella burgdorferi 72a]EEF82305.1 ABC transporter, permease protein [Borreliella burgdorferi WI91-23]EEG98735.1 ABC transporter, permease protein [Borreliella burgdorferi 118a]MCD2371516.1 ABC transporter permease [Borreliella burgdorferi]